MTSNRSGRGPGAPPAPLESWKRSPPAAPEEAEAAALLDALRSAPTLSTAAFARIERQLREKPPAPAAARLGFALAAAGAAAVLAVVGLRRLVRDGPPPPETTAATAAAPAPELLAMRDEASRRVDSAPERPRAEPEQLAASAGGGRAAHHVEMAERRAALAIAPSAGGFAPARPSPEEIRTEKSLPPSPAAHLRKAAGPARFALAAQQDESAAAAAAPVANEQEAAPGARRPAAPEAALARAEQLADARDWSGALALFSQVAIPPGAGPLAERALFGRARCRLALGHTAAARADLTAYLARFPHGRFADQARALLR